MTPEERDACEIDEHGNPKRAAHGSLYGQEYQLQ
jgi:hypothetical protein